MSSNLISSAYGLLAPRQNCGPALWGLFRTG
jgi:hypothetical protein